MRSEAKENRVFGLDLFRAFAIICVMLVHGGFLIEQALPGFPYFSVPDGVELFFVLSGFLIGGILIRLIEKNELGTMDDLFKFWKRRWFRTLPAYYLVLLLNVLFAWMGWNNSKLESFDWKFLLFVHNFMTPFTDFFWESWSLSIEEWFYIVTPVLFLAATKSYTGNRKWIVLASILALLIIPLTYRLSISNQQLDPFWFDVTFRKTVVARLDAIMYGVLFAWLMHYYRHKIIKSKWLLASLGFVVFWASKEYIKSDPTGFHAMTWHFSTTGLGAAMLLPLFADWKSCSNPFGKAITHISLVSYSMYLINLGLVAQVLGHLHPPQNELQSIISYLGFWIIVIVGATLLYRFFEKPITDLRDR